MDYVELERFLEKRINHAKVEVVGASVLGRLIYSVRFDFKCEHTVIIHSSIHAREHITTDLVCELIKLVSRDYYKYKALGVPNIIFVPMVNPDGVMLCSQGIKSVRDKNVRKLLLNIKNDESFSLFKANANGVDLNTNFDAKWGSGKENKFFPSADGFVGYCPMSEPEVRALAILTCKEKPFFTISYHAKGEEIYYQFYNAKENLKRDKKIAKVISHTTRYRIKNTEKSSSGGYKDWCIQKFGIPAITIEVGSDNLTHPISKEFLPKIYARNKNIIKSLSRILKEYTNDANRKRKMDDGCN